ncbi:PASTA domain-containing protein [Tessaracoccus coleopterorum]|uniref:PASTA domain-containing protein n=1 Tax=Tessaracoccus coleopterorum TaxID=2714950 RepID=UPI0018D3EC1E
MISVEPGEGKTVDFNTPITLTVATGKSVVPSLTGMNEAAATQRAQDAGFRIKVLMVPTDDQTPGWCSSSP